jgi:hypothetical protein
MTEEKKPIKVIFAPGAFDDFDGTQEELDAMVAEIQRLAESGEIEELSQPMDENILDEEPEFRDVLEEAIASLAFTPVTLTTLGTASAAGAGARAFINDSNVPAATNFGTVAVSGNTNTVPVYSDGTNWRVG